MSHLWTGSAVRWLIIAILLSPALFLIFGWSQLPQSVLWGLLLLAILCTSLAVALLIPAEKQNWRRTTVFSSRALQPTTQSVKMREELPSIPQTVREIYTSMNPAQFELFSAAVLMALGEGYRFSEHCGQSGDQGIDLRMLNLYNHLVVVQCKQYAPDNHVGQPELRDFLGSIHYHNATYGFFITTSTFTPAARQLIASTAGRIRVIDGRQLSIYLQRRQREIALALADVLGS